ncbi:MAG: hypothetical protein EG822_10870 [Deltaproteobacteria bacterium]|nr:hypothetical protein [Deltaproteobacteria bacterium]TLN02111.1 MAG: hypothetical protein FDZ73_13105 [bacterium]
MIQAYTFLELNSIHLHGCGNTGTPYQLKAEIRGNTYGIPLFLCGDIHVVFGRLNVSKQLQIKAPKRFPAVIGQPELCLFPIDSQTKDRA